MTREPVDDASEAKAVEIDPPCVWCKRRRSCHFGVLHYCEFAGKIVGSKQFEPSTEWLLAEIGGLSSQLAAAIAERDSLNESDRHLAEVVGAAMVIASLAPGEEPANIHGHGLVHDVLDLKHARDAAIAERDRLRGKCARQRRELRRLNAKIKYVNATQGHLECNVMLDEANKLAEMLRVELTTVAERTAKEQREACAKALDTTDEFSWSVPWNPYGPGKSCRAAPLVTDAPPKTAEPPKGCTCAWEDGYLISAKSVCPTHWTPELSKWMSAEDWRDIANGRDEEHHPAICPKCETHLDSHWHRTECK